MLGIKLGQDFESIARFWVAIKDIRLPTLFRLLSYGPFGNFEMKSVFQGHVDGLEGCTVQDCQDVKEMDAYDATSYGRTY